jgi:hypothetical protein
MRRVLAVLAGDSVTVDTEAGAASLEFAEAPSMVKVTTDVGAIRVEPAP